MKVKEILREHDFRPKKRFGQNFLVNERIAEKLVELAGITKDDVVIEPGPGLGILTRPLLERAREVVAVELDKRLCEALTRLLAGYRGLKILNEDILKLDIQRFRKDGTIKIVGNLPYYITSPIIFHLLDQRCLLDSIVIGVQKEVAKRILAGPGSKDYGAISVKVRYYTKASYLMTIDRTQFWPQPDVDAGVIRLEVLKKPGVSVEDEKLLFKVVQRSFGQRRKMLINSLVGLDGVDLEKWSLAGALTNIGIDPKRRPETLSLLEFSKIANLITEMKG